FRTDDSSDSTNGRSWCALEYQDNWKGAAIPYAVMNQSYDSDLALEKAMYCGLELEVHNPANDRVVTVWVVDAFDQSWVHTNASLDLTVSAFQELNGTFNGDKDAVIKNMTWVFTGWLVLTWVVSTFR
ncbi:hypothetical protein DACRYDRAFT_50799, partial [Dacryopinax primogenitus]